MDYQEPPAVVRPSAEAGGREAERKAMAKIDPMLTMEFEEQPNQEYGVVVTFTGLPPDKALDALELRAVPPNEATGNLSRKKIEELARRSDVRSIRSRPRPRAL